MSFTHWVSNRLHLTPRHVSCRKRCTERSAIRPTLESLDDRWLPSTLTVRNNLDAGTNSLRAAIAAAHNNDIINFAPSIYGQTITLTSGELLIQKNLTIAGPGAGQLIISGNNTSRAFEVARTAKQVTLSGLTISNGVAFVGGGIHNLGTLTLISSTLSMNRATNDGGGIYNEGALTVSDSTLSNNSTSAYGGGISNFGKLTVNSATLSNNTAAQGGGGIENQQGIATISGTILSGNSAAVQGGGIYGGSGTLIVSGCSIFSNSAIGSYGEGGGIYNYNAVLTITGGSLSGNDATTFGGGISIRLSTGIYGSVKISGCILSGNSATSGGGIYNPGAAGRLTVGNCVFLGNAQDHIVGLYSDGSGNTFS